MSSQSLDSFGAMETLKVGSHSYKIFNPLKVSPEIHKFPLSLRVLLENLLRKEDNQHVNSDDIQALLQRKSESSEISFFPARVLMQDFTGVPAVVDLAAMRDAMNRLGGDPQKINPLVPVDLVIDHSVMVDTYGTADAAVKNVLKEFERNHERYQFLKWGQGVFKNFKVVPPGTGICHQVNLEYLAQTVWTDGGYAYPDSLVGTDSHTTMVNGLSVLGWGVGGIEAEAVMLGQPLSMLVPEVIGFRLKGHLKEGTTATDLVLTVTEMLRKKGVVGKFVEFFGEGLAHMSLADRATIANMAPEYGATCGFFPIDDETLKYLRLSGRSEERVRLVEAYAKTTGLWRDSEKECLIEFNDVLELDLSSVEASLSGPKRPQDRVALSRAAQDFNQQLSATFKKNELKTQGLTHGDVVIAAITSCTNTSNPSVMLGAGLVAKKAVEKGLKTKSWVKTSLAPGSKVVSEYLEKSGLQNYLDQLGFNVVGYGCTTCIGNSGPLNDDIVKQVEGNDLVVAAVLSGNRNFEGRINPHVKANYLASPMLVVAYALFGKMTQDILTTPLGEHQGKPVYLKDIWPTSKEIQDAMSGVLTREMFVSQYSDVFTGTPEWQGIEVATGETYHWPSSTYIKNPPFFEGLSKDLLPISDIQNARVLALLGDSITTDHISPAGNIKKDSPAGLYLQSQGVQPVDFNSYGSRRGNDEVMVRGTFANIRIKNEMMGGEEGGMTLHLPGKERMSIYDAAVKYREEQAPLIVIAGKEYGTGSSRDWAAKGTKLLGVRAVIAESFERIHRSNLIGMGVLPLQFLPGESRLSHGFTGEEMISLEGLKGMKPGQTVQAKVEHKGQVRNVNLRLRIDTEVELEYYRNGGILNYVLRQF